MTGPKPKKTPADGEGRKLREPTSGERKAISEAIARIADRPRRVEVKQDTSKAGTLALGHPHSDGHGWGDHLTDTFGTASQAFCEQALIRLANATKERGSSPPTEGQTNAALALMGAIAPKDELEAAIGEQIITTHLASLDFLNLARANAGQYVESAAAYTNMATKVSRTMAAHVEALAKLRSGGKQTHEVRYVYVNGPAVFGDHAQTVVGGVETHRGGGNEGKPDQPHGRPALASMAATPMPEVRSEEPPWDALPGPRDAEQAPLRVPRRQEPRSTEGEGERALQDRPVDAGATGGPRARARRAGVGAV